VLEWQLVDVRGGALDDGRRGDSLSKGKDGSKTTNDNRSWSWSSDDNKDQSRSQNSGDRGSRGGGERGGETES